MSLPPELRICIYEFTLDYKHTISTIHLNPKSDKYTNKRPKYKNLLRVSKQISKEALPVYYGVNSFIYHIDSFDSAQFQLAADRLRYVISNCGIKPFGTFKFHITGSIWSDLRAILPLLQFMRETGFYPSTAADSEHYQQALESGERGRLVDAASHSMFILHNADCVHALRALEEAVRLAKGAHLRKASQDIFAGEFEKFVGLKLAHGRGRAALQTCERRKAAREKQVMMAGLVGAGTTRG